MSEVRDVNKQGYNKLAPEFVEEKRITTANFHELSQDFFRYVMNSKLKKGMKVLEIGVGKGWLRKNFNWPKVDYIAVDIAEMMIKELDNTIVCSVEDMPFEDAQFDCVISSLGDPYFYKEALVEISRVLRRDGLFLFSTPANEWARKLRGERIFSSFKVGNENIETYSFTYNAKDMINLWRSCGFEPLTMQNWYAGGIRCPISADISKIGNSVTEVAIVTTAIFVNKKNG